MASFGLQDRLRFHAADFSSDPLPRADVLILGHILQDWDLEQKRLLMSLNMLIELPGGFVYTAADCSGWLRDAGFRETYVEHLAGPDSMLVGIK